MTNILKFLTGLIFKKQPRNWREAFEQSQGKQSRAMDAALRKESMRLIGSEDYECFEFEMARAKNVGIEWYVWETCGDERVRKSHKKMQGVLVPYDHPPSPEHLIGEQSIGKYHAGQLKDCRCYAQPLLELSDVNWPHRVYWRGAIIRMKRSEFKAIMNMV